MVAILLDCSMLQAPDQSVVFGENMLGEHTFRKQH